MNSYLKREFVLKILIYLGLLGILINLYGRYAQPYLAELSLRKLDEQRINDLETLSTEINDAGIPISDQIGASSTVYISLPSDDPFCSDLVLPPLAAGWLYHCSSSSTLENIDGTGWLPVNLSKSRKISKLPIDPKNLSDTSEYYTYNSNSSSSDKEYIFTAKLASHKYLSLSQEQDQAVDLSRLAIGNDRDLWLKANGLAAYWPIDAKLAKLGSDLSPYKRDIDIAQSLESCSGQCIENTKTDLSTIRLPATVLSGADTFSYNFEFKLSSVPDKNWIIFNPGKLRLDVSLEGGSGALFVWYYDDQNTNYLIYKSYDKEFIDNKWHQISVQKAKDYISIYIDGRDLIQTSLSTKTNADSNGFIALPRGMSIRQVRIYRIDTNR